MKNLKNQFRAERRALISIEDYFQCCIKYQNDTKNLMYTLANDKVAQLEDALLTHANSHELSIQLESVIFNEEDI